MKLSLIIHLLLLIALSRCAFHDKSSATSDAARSFTNLQSSIISSKCTSCHSGVAPSGGINLSSYAEIMRSGTVVAGNAEASSFYSSVARGTMPPGSPLAASEVMLIKDWINSGALNSASLRIDSISPSVGAAGRQTLVTILGQGFSSGAVVKFSGQEASSVTVVSSTKITCLSPAKSSGQDDVVVINFDGTSVTARSAFSYGAGGGNSGLSISSVFPTSGPSESLLEITGIGIREDTVVMVGGQVCPKFQVNPPTVISCTVPFRSQSGAVDVVLTQPSGESALLVRGFLYTVSASFTSLMANTFQPKCVSCHGASNPSAGVAMNTYERLMASAIVVPRDPDHSPLFQTVASHQMPRNAAPLSDGEVTQIRNWIFNGALNDTPPNVTNIFPNVGANAGGTAVRVVGSRFLPGATVLIGDSACTPVTVNSARTEIQCVTSPHAGDITVVDVVVVNPPTAGMSSSRSTGGSQIYTYRPPPQITAFNPASVPSSNTAAITITGRFFMTNLIFRFGSINGVLSGPPTCDASANCTVRVTPPIQRAGPVDVRVQNSDGQFQDLPGGFTYTAGSPPVVSAIDKPFSYNNINKVVTITGSNFLVGAMARIGGNALQNQTRVSATEIRGTVDPDDLLGEQIVTVTNADGLSSESTTVKHTILQGISITRVSPSSGTIGGGTIVTILGSGFVNGATAELKTQVKVGVNPCATLQFNSDTEMICITPRATSAGTVRLEAKNPADAEGFTPSASVDFVYTSP